MPFFSLALWYLLFIFFYKAPVFFNQRQIERLEKTIYNDSLQIAQRQYEQIAEEKKAAVTTYSLALHEKNEEREKQGEERLATLQHQSDSVRNKVKSWITQSGGDANDTNYIFLNFVVDYLPAGMVGLLIAIIFLASWGSIAAALNALASSTMVDFHRRFSKKQISPENEFRISQWYTMGWGVFCIIVAMFTYNAGNSLIEAVNVLGSLFYGVILGVFLVAFFLKKIRNGNVVFFAAILAECLVLTVFLLTKIPGANFKIGFLWLNPIGAFGVIGFSLLLHNFFASKKKPGLS